jgi:SHS2 domain-containing protein
VICGGVKAATLHQLSLTEGPSGWEGFVILDV